mgnify:CR=1 FL=1
MFWSMVSYRKSYQVRLERIYEGFRAMQWGICHGSSDSRRLSCTFADWLDSIGCFAVVDWRSGGVLHRSITRTH